MTPDLTTMGKVIGGGLPVGAYGGKREIMQMVAPSGPMYQVRSLFGSSKDQLQSLHVCAATPLALAANAALLEPCR